MGDVKMSYACYNFNNTQNTNNTILSHTYDYGKEVDTSITLPCTITTSTFSFFKNSSTNIGA